MRSNRSVRARRGTTSIEFAVTFPLAFFLLLATMVGGLGIFRYQQMSSLAREAARWASVHGGQYAEETGQPAATPQDIYDNAIVPQAATLDLRQLSYDVKWVQSNMPSSLVGGDYETPKANTVTVTLTYRWFPETSLIGPYTLTSSSTAQMMY
jgi:Flp pilus assembly protein TadG